MNDLCQGYTTESGFFVQSNGIIRDKEGILVCRIEEIKSLQAELMKAHEQRVWMPIELYDTLRTKPKFAVFYVAATKPAQNVNNWLAEMIITQRSFGSRTITHFKILPEPPHGD